MITKHTAAPWFFDGYQDGFPKFTDAEGRQLLKAGGDDCVADDERSANVRVVIWAAELLQALKQCAGRLGEMDCGPEFDNARELIAIAEGRA